MDLNLNILNLARGLSKHAVARQSILAENVANADTPGYKARDIPQFSEVYQQGGFGALQMKATRAGHLQGQAGTPAFRAEEVVEVGAESPNGNTVSLEDQLLKSAEVRQSHSLALGVYSKSMDIMRSAMVRR